MKIKYFSPSFKRPEKSKTQLLFNEVTLVVCESQADEYIANKNRVWVVPDSAQGNLCRIRNYILDKNTDADCVVLMDDDYNSFNRFNKQKNEKLTELGFYEFVENACIMAKDVGAKFWGVNCLSDKGAYREHTPFSFVAYIGGPFQCFMKGNELRYDENLPLKEDYDMTLQQLNKYRKVLRFNAYNYDVKQAKQVGGCATYRNVEKEKSQLQALQNK